LNSILAPHSQGLDSNSCTQKNEGHAYKPRAPHWWLPVQSPAWAPTIDVCWKDNTGLDECVPTTKPMGGAKSATAMITITIQIMPRT